MATPTNEEFPLETPSVVPGSLLSVAMMDHPYGRQKVACLSQLSDVQREYVFLTEANLRELVSICDGRLFNREPLVENMAALSVSDQTMAFIRDHERLLTEFVVSNGKLETEERLLITLVQACVLMAIKVVRQQA